MRLPNPVPGRCPPRMSRGHAAGAARARGAAGLRAGEGPVQAREDLHKGRRACRGLARVGTGGGAPLGSPGSPALRGRAGGRAGSLTKGSRPCLAPRTSLPVTGDQSSRMCADPHTLRLPTQTREALTHPHATRKRRTPPASLLQINGFSGLLASVPSWQWKTSLREAVTRPSPREWGAHLPCQPLHPSPSPQMPGPWGEGDSSGGTTLPVPSAGEVHWHQQQLEGPLSPV